MINKSLYLPHGFVPVMIYKKNIYSKNARRIAWLLLVLFIAFSIQLPLVDREVYKNDQTAGAVLIDMQDCLAANSVYQAPMAKSDIGQHRTIVTLFFKTGYSLVPGLGCESEIMQKQPVEKIFPLSTIPVYLFDRILRI